MAITQVQIPQASIPVTEGAAAIASLIYRKFWENLVTSFNTVVTTVNAIPGVNVFTVATQPTLGVSDAGYVGYVSDTEHFVRWTGVMWTFMGGDEPGKFQDFAVAPSASAYALCNGAGTTLLAVGATLTLSAFTTPNRSGTPNYLKSAAAYTGVINAASGSTGTGSTGTGVTGTDVTGDTAPSGAAAGPIGLSDVQSGSGTTVASALHTHVVTVNAHHHTVPALTVPALSVPALGVGSIDMPNLGTLPYVRR